MRDTLTGLIALSLLTACAAEEAEMDTAALDTGIEEPAAPMGQTEMGQMGATNGAQANLLDAQGQTVGTATLTPSGDAVLVSVQATGLSEGTHAVHIHETGSCEAPEFTSAGGHFAPEGRSHGLENPEGPHAGDMPNMEVAADGTGRLEYSNPRITLGTAQNSLFDADGSAIVVHATADDMVSDPAGNAGSRVACGVVEQA